MTTNGKSHVPHRPDCDCYACRSKRRDLLRRGQAAMYRPPHPSGCICAHCTHFERLVLASAEQSSEPVPVKVPLQPHERQQRAQAIGAVMLSFLVTLAIGCFLLALVDQCR